MDGEDQELAPPLNNDVQDKIESEIRSKEVNEVLPKNIQLLKEQGDGAKKEDNGGGNAKNLKSTIMIYGGVITVVGAICAIVANMRRHT